MVPAGDCCMEIHLLGDWQTADSLPSMHYLQSEIKKNKAKQINFVSEGLQSWNSVLLVFVLDVRKIAKKFDIDVDCSGLPNGVQKLMKLSEAVPEAKDAKKKVEQTDLIKATKKKVKSLLEELRAVLHFTGIAVLVAKKFIQGKASYRYRDLMLHIQEAGAEALPIITIISFLVGVILAYVGAAQLRQFGAEIFVADIVAIGIVREMGPMMAAVIMAGRTGASYAAALGTMKVNQEIDAFKTMAISPFEFLVFPRLIALLFMMPLLTLYADFIGMIGGATVSNIGLNISTTKYILQTQSALSIDDFVVSLVKGTAFGVIVAMFGCFRGLRAGYDASEVGNAATTAVVSSLVCLVISDALFSIIFGQLGM